MTGRYGLTSLALVAALSVTPPTWARGANCVFRSPSQILLLFGPLDPSRGFSVQQRALAARHEDLDVGDCAPGQTMTLRIEGGQHDADGRPRMQHALRPSTYLRYAVRIAPTVQRAPGNGRYISFQLTGSIEPADLADAPAGPYSDVLRVSVTP
jgi:hypothetical protein